MESGDSNQLWECQVSAPTLLGEVTAWAGAPGSLWSSTCKLCLRSSPGQGFPGPHPQTVLRAHHTVHTSLTPVFALPPSKGSKCSLEGLRNPPPKGSLGLGRGWGGVELPQAEPLGREGAQLWTGRPRSGRKRGRGYSENILLPEPLWVTQSIKDSQHRAFQS